MDEQSWFLRKRNSHSERLPAHKEKCPCSLAEVLHELPSANELRGAISGLQLEEPLLTRSDGSIAQGEESRINTSADVQSHS